MDELLYHIFVHNFNKGEKSISFEKIKRVISNNISEFDDTKRNFNFLYKLLKFGIIDKVEKNKYALSNSVLITNSKNDFTLGVNIPTEVLKLNKDFIINEYLGLTIFKVTKIKVAEYEIDSMFFDLDKTISQLHSTSAIIKNWKSVNGNEIGQFTKLEKYNPYNGKWEHATIIENNCLYKFYLFNDVFYKYLFFAKNQYYIIELEEYEKLNTLKLMDANKSLFKYDSLTNSLKLKPYHAYPVYLYKILLLNHIMNFGEIPMNNEFKIDSKPFLKVTKTLNLNYTLQ